MLWACIYADIYVVILGLCMRPSFRVDEDGLGGECNDHVVSCELYVRIPT